MPDAHQPLSASNTLRLTAAMAVLLCPLLNGCRSTRHAANTPPTWPLKAGDTFTLKPGDPIIAKWADSPDSNGFLVQLTDADGKPVPDPEGSVGNKICGLAPDFMAAPDQPGGTLTLLTQEGTGDWRLHWRGGETMPPSEAPTDAEDIVHRNSSCGKDAYITMSLAQLHDWFNMQSGITASATSGGHN